MNINVYYQEEAPKPAPVVHTKRYTLDVSEHELTLLRKGMSEIACSDSNFYSEGQLIAANDLWNQIDDIQTDAS